MTSTLVDLVAELTKQRGLESTPRVNNESDHRVWELKDPETGFTVAIVMSGIEVAQSAAEGTTAFLVETKFRNAERTLQNLKEQQERRVHELMLISQGWTPPPGWKHPFKKAEP
jgi:hypothetical protein